MDCHNYLLPDIVFVGGKPEPIVAKLATLSGDIFEAEGCTVYFSLVPYSHQYLEPILRKQATVSKGDGGYYYAEVTLTREETVGLHDTYIYQFTVISAEGEPDPNNQGLLHIRRNIDRVLIR